MCQHHERAHCEPHMHPGPHKCQTPNREGQPVAEGPNEPHALATGYRKQVIVPIAHATSKPGWPFHCPAGCHACTAHALHHDCMLALACMSVHFYVRFHACCGRFAPVNSQILPKHPGRLGHSDEANMQELKQWGTRKRDGYSASTWATADSHSKQSSRECHAEDSTLPHLEGSQQRSAPCAARSSQIVSGWDWCMQPR